MLTELTMRSVRWLGGALLIGLAACDSPAGVEPEPETVSTVVVAAKSGAWTGSLMVGQSIELAASAIGPDGKQTPAPTATWASSASAVAEVSPTGVVIARSAGSAQIQANVGGRLGTLFVQVIADPLPVVTTVSVSPAAAVMQVGQSRQYTARAFDAAGNELNGLTVTWSANGAANVNASGLVYAREHGYATITASIAGVQSSVGLTVQTPESSSDDVRLIDFGGNALPAIWRQDRSLDANGIPVNRTWRVTAGRLIVNLAAQRYEQRFTIQLWQDWYWLQNGQPVYLGEMLKETRVVEDAGSVMPLFEGSGELVFSSTVFPLHNFRGIGTAAGFETIQPVNATGSIVRLKFAR